jgi:hypothetical protein
MPHVLGARGDIIAILWAPKDALHAPPLPDRNNKILCVSRVSSLTTAWRLRATLAGGGRVISLAFQGAPGPSIIDMPAAGCWTMDVSWAGHTDVVRLRYVSAPQ